MFIIFSVFYILVAAAMIVLILMQRGEGANAGASFGGGSSGTVFGASGSASFMSRSTGVLAAVFMLLSLGMAVYLAHSGAPKPVSDLGVMSGASTSTPTKAADNTPAAAATAKPETAVPQATVPAGAGSDNAATENDQSAGQTSASGVPSATVGGDKAGKAGSDNNQTSSESDKNRH